MDAAGVFSSDTRGFTTSEATPRPATDWEARDIAAPIPEDWRTGAGDALDDGVVRARIVGRAGAPVVVAIGGISADRFAAEEPNRSRGWWSGLVRAGGGVNLDRFRVLSIDFAPQAPKSLSAFRPDDQARLLALALDAAGVARAHALVGASYGGAVSLAFARLYPERLDRLVIAAAAHRPHPMAVAWRGIQRRIVDFAIKAGAPGEGVALARELAMTTYRSPEEFLARFDQAAPGENDPNVYLAARGHAYAQTMPAARFRTLSAAIDRQNEIPEAIATPTLVVASDTDRLVPPALSAELAERLAGPAEFVLIPSLYGHDAFLKDAEAFARPIRAFLDKA